MKKILPGTDLGGVPINKYDFRTVLNSEIWNAIEGTMSLFDSNTEGVIVSGCIITANGGNFDITAGIVYLNKEFMRLPAAINQTYTKHIQPATPTQEARVFGNGVSHNWIENKDAVLGAATPGAGQYITINSLTGAEDRRLSNILINRQIAVVLESTLQVKGTSQFDQVITIPNGSSSGHAVNKLQLDAVESALSAAITAGDNLKVSKAGDTMSGTLEVTGGIRNLNTGPYFLKKVIDIGDWNMDSTNQVFVALGVTRDKVKSVDVIIRLDGGAQTLPLNHIDTAGVLGGSWDFINASNDISLQRVIGGLFDNTSYDQTSFNRGWVFIEYEA